MVVSINRETPIYTPKYYNPYYGDPQNGVPLVLGNPQMLPKAATGSPRLQASTLKLQKAPNQTPEGLREEGLGF